jgi:hypothetical protein
MPDKDGLDEPERGNDMADISRIILIRIAAAGIPTQSMPARIDGNDFMRIDERCTERKETFSGFGIPMEQDNRSPSTSAPDVERRRRSRYDL